MVKREPNIIRGHVTALIWSLYVIYGFYDTFFVSSLRYHSSPFFVLLYILFATVGTGWIVVAQELFWHRQDQRRQQAARGDQSLFASFQPTSDASAIPLPTTIIQGPTKSWTAYLIIAALLLIALFNFLLDQLIQQSTFADKVLVLFLVVLITALFANYAVAPIARGYQQLTVDESGISVRVGVGRIHRMRWEDARLFAASTGYRSSSYIKQFPTFYELSNANEVVRWRWMRTRGFVAIEPALPIHEYDRQMNSVLAVVAAKTRLTLYDVRPESKK